MPQLPRGAKMLAPVIHRRVGTWSKITYDAEVRRCGIRWLRVKDGFGGRADSEDWVADLPAVAISVSDYNWNRESFGVKYGRTFDQAVRGLLPKFLKDLQYRIQKLQTEIADRRKSEQRLIEAVAIAKKASHR